MWSDGFNSFIEAAGVQFVRDGEYRYHFPDKGMEIRLVPLREAALGVEWERGVTCVFEDRWHCCRELLEKRILAHLGQFRSLFARKCEVFVPTPEEAAGFLDRWHIYGSVRCKYRYALRYDDETVAISTFSAPRPMIRQGREVLSYEWLRFASLPDMRISGGMGRLLDAFARDIGPQDIMSYADLEWSDGAVYERLGFTLAGRTAPVEFAVDPVSWQRTHLSKLQRNGAAPDSDAIVIRNLGSAKYVRTF